MSKVPQDDRAHGELVRRAEALLEQSLSAARAGRSEPAALGFHAVCALAALSRNEAASPRPPALKGHWDRIHRAAERELVLLEPAFEPTLPPRERPEPAPGRRVPAPLRRASKGTTRASAPVTPVVTAEQAASADDPRVPLTRIASGVGLEERRLLLGRVGALAADPSLLSANDAAWLPGALRQVQPSPTELAPLVATLMGRLDVRRSKAALQHLGELCLDRDAIDESAPIFAELAERFPGDLVIRRLLAKRDEFA